MCAKYYLAAIGKDPANLQFGEHNRLRVLGYMEFQEEDYERIAGGLSKFSPDRMLVDHFDPPYWARGDSLLDKLPRELREQFSKQVEGADFLVELYDIHPNVLDENTLKQLLTRYIIERLVVFPTTLPAKPGKSS